MSTYPEEFKQLEEETEELQIKVNVLQAENKRLKEALRDIADHVCPKIYSPTCPEIAQQALQEKPK